MMPEPTTATAAYPWLWDVTMSSEDFERLLAGGTLPGYDQTWALIRLLDYAPFSEIRRLLPAGPFIELWPRLAPSIRSTTRREGMAFFCEWLLAEKGRG
jgi:hypothetical protein